MSQLATFGDNRHGQLGRRGCAQPLPLHDLPSLPSSCSAVSAGAAHTVVLTPQGEVWCVGDRDKCGGDRGRNLDCNSSACSFQRITSLRGLIVSRIGTGASHSVAVGIDHSLHAWGTCPAWSETPSLVGTLPAPVQAVTCGAMHTLLLLVDGRVFTFGESPRGGLGLGAEVSFVGEPAHVPGLDGLGVSAVAAGGGHSLACTHSGAVYSWGDNRRGQLGVGNKDPQYTPVQIEFADAEDTVSAESAVSCGDYHSCVIRAGQLWSFGSGSGGQLGLGDFSSRESPQLVQGLQQVDSVAAGGGFDQAHTLALTATGAVYGFGSCERGQLGTVTAHGLPPDSVQYKDGEVHAVALPVVINTSNLPEGSVVKSVSCGWLHSVLLYDSMGQNKACACEAEEVPWASTPDGVLSKVSNDAAVQLVMLPTMLSAVRHQGASCGGHPIAALCSNCSWFPMAKSVSVLSVWSRVSRLWRDLSADDRLWEPLFEQLVSTGAPLSELETASINDRCAFKRLFADRFARNALQKALQGKTGGGIAVSVYPSPTGLEMLSARAKEAAANIQGSALSRLTGGLFGGKKENKLVWVGLDSAGRTTALFYLTTGDIMATIPTIGFNVESYEHRSRAYSIWDVGGGDKIRPLYLHYCCPEMAALGWWVDSNDRNRIADSTRWLHYVAQRGEVPRVIVYASKQDLPGAMTAAEIVEQMKLNTLGVQYYVQPCKMGEGLLDAFEWLEQQLKL